MADVAPRHSPFFISHCPSFRSFVFPALLFLVVFFLIAFAPVSSLDFFSFPSLHTLLHILLSRPSLYCFFNLLILALTFSSGVWNSSKSSPIQTLPPHTIITALQPIHFAVAEQLDTVTPFATPLNPRSILDDILEDEAELGSESPAASPSLLVGHSSVLDQQPLIFSREPIIDDVEDTVFFSAYEEKNPLCCESVSMASTPAVTMQLCPIDEPIADSKVGDELLEQQSVSSAMVVTSNTPRSEMHLPVADSVVGDHNSDDTPQARFEDNKAANSTELEDNITEAIHSSNGNEDQSDEECELTTEELNARADIFIKEFRRKLMRTANDDEAGE